MRLTVEERVLILESYLKKHLKDTVYRSNPRDLKQLKTNITRAIEEVNKRTLENLRGTW